MEGLTRFIELNENKEVFSVRFGKEINESEIQSDTGEIGQIQQADGSFIDAPVEPINPKPTLEQQMVQLQQDNLILMDALATVYEAILAGGTV